MKILIVNGPNLQLLGSREPDVYGALTLVDVVERVRAHAAGHDVEIDAVQSNVEGELVSAIGAARGEYDGMILNPAAYTHTSVALRDALQACEVPCVEVHLSNTAAREGFRHESLTAAACVGQIMGFGVTSYVLALDALLARIAPGEGDA